MTTTPANDASHAVTHLRIGRIVSAVGVLGGLAASGLWWASRPSIDDLLVSSRSSLARDQYAEALDHAEEAIRRGAAGADVQLVAAEASLKLHDLHRALLHLNRVDDADGPPAVSARVSAASIYLQQNEVSRAEDQLRRALAIDPDNALAHKLLAQVLGLQGRRWESQPHLLRTIRDGNFELEDLCYLADLERAIDISPEMLTGFLDGDDPKGWLGAACVAIAYRRFDQALELLNRCRETETDLVEAHLRIGKLLLSHGQPEQMAVWNAALLAGAEQFPDTWFIRSQWVQLEGRYELAVACLWKALTLNPNHLGANHQMGQLLSLLGRDQAAASFVDRGAKLTRLATLANEVFMGDTRSNAMGEAANLLESLGRMHEAFAWAVAAQYDHPGETWPLAMQQRLFPQMSAAMPWTLTDAPPDVPAAFKVIAWDPSPATSAAGTPPEDPPTSPSSITFADATNRVGIDFRYENGQDSSREGRLMFEYTGGGVGALDYDIDGWPDLLFTQGGLTAPFNDSQDVVDSLFRNRHGESFEDVAVRAHMSDYGFGQGLACGDINNDGFPDVYLANIDGNRLYVNNGDGTFSDMTDVAGIGHDKWTTSVAIADLNGDGTPDLYDATFLEDQDIFERVCTEDGIPRSCAPAGFGAAVDCLYAGNGDGTFTETSEQAGILVPEGDGLGLLVADFDGSGDLSVFIANDGRANFYFRRQPAADSSLLYKEEALTRGLAFDRDGRSQACMGIASSDFDGDGTWDLFVTNFYNESNTLYSQIAVGFFSDRTQPSGMRESSLGLLGFGTQAVDGDLDGRADLVVANGHVDDFEHKGIPYRMPMQCYRNEGEGRFALLDSATIGPAFNMPLLGRGMAVIDWNRDGREEVAVSLLEDPSILLENTTNDVGHHLVVRLVATQSARDAVGARVIAEVGGRHLLRQITAGDGYQSSNQKQVVIGLGQAGVVDRLTITWPGGDSQQFTNVPADQTLLIREDDATPWTLPTDSQ